METERALLLRLAHQINYFYADRLGATKRSARFYGEYVAVSYTHLKPGLQRGGMFH